ncbi:hypothetical protein [Neptunitalea chrysea]|nr:hypothetical protein [Neptunitalea chrysea]
MAVVQLVMRVLKENHMENIYVSHAYFILQFVFVSLLFKELIPNLRFRMLSKYLLIGIPIIVSILFVFDPKAFWNFYIPEIIMCSIPLIGYIIYYLFISLEVKKSVWILVSIGLFVYLISSLLVYVGGNYLINNDTESGYIGQLWLVNNFIYLGYQVLITVEWYKNFRRKEVVL